MYDKMFGKQRETSISDPETLDSSGEPLQKNSRYWVVDDGEHETYIYNDLIDIDNYLENFSDSGHDSYRSAVLSLYGYVPDVALVTYLGNHRFEEEK